MKNFYVPSVWSGWWRSSETKHLLKCKILLPDSALCFMGWQTYYGDNIQCPHLTEFKSRRTFPGQVFFSSLLMAANTLHMWVTVTACRLCLLRTMERTLQYNMVNVSWKEYQMDCLKPSETVCSALERGTLFHDSLWSLWHCNSKLCKEKWMKADYKF